MCIVEVGITRYRRGYNIIYMNKGHCQGGIVLESDIIRTAAIVRITKENRTVQEELLFKPVVCGLLKY